MKRAIATILIAMLVIVAALLVLPDTAVGAGGSCPRYEQTIRSHAPRGGWSVSRMSYYAWRESRCTPTAVNRGGGDSGLFQIHPVTWPWLSKHFGLKVNRAWLLNPTNNVRAAAALCEFARRAFGSCYQPWAVH